MADDNHFERVNILTDLACDHIELLLDKLGVDYSVKYNSIAMRCPIHIGDNKNACNIYPNGYIRGIWKCLTHGCHETYGKGLIGFIRGVLSTQSRTRATWWDAVHYLEDFIGQKIDGISIDSDEIERLKFIRETTALNDRPQKKSGLTRQQIRSILEIPSPYFISRGFSAKILDEYDVGLLKMEGKSLNNRVVFPIYDEDYKFVIGGVGRIPYENYKDFNAPKWKNSEGFNRESHLFNIWRAKPVIRECNTAILVESQGDVLRLEEAGIHNSLGIFGDNLTDSQEIILERCGATSLVLLFNSDEAGQKATKRIAAKCERLYSIHVVQLETKDVGEMSIDQVRQELKPTLLKLSQG